MRKLVLAALSISIVLAALSLAMMLIGRSDPAQTDLFHYLTLCDGQPCYLGVVPGTTGWDVALEHLGNKPEVEFGVSTNFAFRPQGFSGTALLLAANDASIVGEIDLNMRPASVSIGSLIMHIGTPCAVVNTPGMIGVVFPGMSTITFTPDQGLYPVAKPTILIDEINLFNRFQTCDQVLQDTSDQPWQGFKRYMN